MWMFEQLLTSPTKASVKALVTVTNSTDSYHGAALKSYSAFVQFHINVYVFDDNIAKWDADMCDLRQESMTPAEYAQ